MKGYSFDAEKVYGFSTSDGRLRLHNHGVRAKECIGRRDLQTAAVVARLLESLKTEKKLLKAQVFVPRDGSLWNSGNIPRYSCF